MTLLGWFNFIKSLLNRIALKKGVAMKNTGGQAFPGKIDLGFKGVGYNGETQEILKDQPGMTLRDYFAGQALVGMISISTHSSDTGDITSQLVSASFTMADAMIAERSRNEKS